MQVDIFNYYAITILEQLGNNQPLQYEIDEVETLLKQFLCVNIKQELYHGKFQSLK